MGFLGSLVGGYAETMLKKEQLQHQEEVADKKVRIEVLQHALDSGKLTPEAQQAAWEQLEEITGSGGKGKGKKGSDFSLSKIMGRLTGHTGGKQQYAPIEGVPRDKVGGGGAPAPERGVGRPGTPPADAVSLGQPPAPPQRSRTFKTPQELNQEAIDAQTALAEAQRALNKKWRAEDAVEATAAMNKAKTREEKAIVEAEFGIKMPPEHYQYATVKMPDGSVRPAGYDPQTNQYLEPGTNLVLEGAIKYVAPRSTEEKKEQLINSAMQAYGFSREEAEKWFAKQDVRIEEAKGQPQETHTITVEPTPEGPAVTKGTVTRHGPRGKVGDISEAGKEFIKDFEKEHGTPGGTPGINTGIDASGKVTGSAALSTPTSISLPFAIPKEGRVAIRKATDEYENAKLRYNLMKETEEKIKKDPKYAGQGDVVLLYNHIALARGERSSIRPTRLMVEEAKKARTIPEGIKVSYQGNFVSGASLSPNQRRYMVETAAASTRAQQKKLLDEEVRYGIKVHVLTKDGKQGYVDKAEFKAHPDLYTEIQ